MDDFNHTIRFLGIMVAIALVNIIVAISDIKNTDKIISVIKTQCVK